MVHTGRYGARSGGEVLHLFHSQTVSLQVQRQFHHIAQSAAGVTGDEIGDESLLFTEPGVFLAEKIEEAFEALTTRFPHDCRNSVDNMLRRYLEESSDVMGQQFTGILRLSFQKIIADARGNGQVFDAGQGAGRSEKLRSFLS